MIISYMKFIKRDFGNYYEYKIPFTIYSFKCEVLLLQSLFIAEKNYIVTGVGMTLLIF